MPRMALEEAFNDIVLTPLLKNSKVRETLKKYNGTGEFDRYIREDYLKRGQALCANETMARFYCYTYLYQHLDAYKAIMKQEEEFFERCVFERLDKVLFVDIGCGPMTSCLALADYYQQSDVHRRLALQYIGFDHSSKMTDLALEFGKRRDLFSERFRWAYPDQKHPLWTKDLKHTVGTNGTLILNYSYFFGQGGIHKNVLSEIQRVKKITAGCEIDDVFVVYLNKDNQGDNGAYRKFKAELGLAGQVNGPMPYRFRCLRQLKEDRRWFESKSLYYEIARLDWKKI